MVRFSPASFLRRRRRYQTIDPDEIFIDAENLPEFDKTQLEGRIERPLSRNAFRAFFIMTGFIGLVLAAQLVYLQIFRHTALAARAEANTLSEISIVTTRGLIVDRNGALLAGNTATSDPQFATRVYPLGDAAANLVGYVSYPKQDARGDWYQTTTQGVTGIEEAYDSALAGENGTRITETNAAGQDVSGTMVSAPVPGADVHVSIDAGIQQQLYENLHARADGSGYRGGAGVIMDITNGQLIAVASYPSFDPTAMSSGQPAGTVQALLADTRSPFLDRPVSGLYTPGSVVKPYLATAALNDHVISPDKQILSTGSISVPNPYDPTHPSVFLDWRPNGLVDMRHAIAVSSDVYFYEVGGGFQNQPGLGISAIEKYMREYGFGTLTGVPLPNEADGVVPGPAWKAENFNGETWYLGDTYHTSIGQYGFKVTMMQLVRAVAALANGGTLVTPEIIEGQAGPTATVPIPDSDLEVAREGMRLCVTINICGALNIPGIAVAGKTGTAQIGAHNQYMNSLIEGFFPYDHPRYAFAVVMEQGPTSATQGAQWAMGQVLRWMMVNRPSMVGLATSTPS